MKIFLVSLIFTSFFICSNIHAQVMPVFDAESLANAAEMFATLKEQYKELQAHGEQLKREYESITGTRVFADFLKTESFKDNLPTDWNGTYDRIRQSGYDGLTTTAKAIYDKNKIYDKCQSITVDDEKKVCQAQSIKAAQDQAFALEALQKSQARMDNIGKLLDQVKETQDPKGIADLQARIATEQSLIANDQAKLQLFKMASEAEDRAQEQRQEEIDARIWSSKKFNNPPPIKFDPS